MKKGGKKAKKKEVSKRYEILENLSVAFKKEIEKNNPRSKILNKLFNELYNFATKDALTGVFNRQALTELLDREMYRAFDEKLPLSIILFDIDNFKDYNDTFGHQQGDEALREVTKTVIKNTKKEDFVARYGGEEFMIVLIDTPLKKAIEVAEKIRKEVSIMKIKPVVKKLPPGYEHITISLGVAELTKKGVEDMIHRADMALYGAKLHGKNKIGVSEKTGKK